MIIRKYESHHPFDAARREGKGERARSSLHQLLQSLRGPYERGNGHVVLYEGLRVFLQLFWSLCSGRPQLARRRRSLLSFFFLRLISSPPSSPKLHLPSLHPPQNPPARLPLSYNSPTLSPRRISLSARHLFPSNVEIQGRVHRNRHRE